MQFPSISQTAADARKTAMRFPFVLLISLLGTICAIVLIEKQPSEEPTVFISLLYSSILGIPFLTTLTLLSEKKQWGIGISIGAQVIGLLLLGLYSFMIPHTMEGVPMLYTLRQLLLGLALVLLVFVVPYSKNEQVHDYWYFGKTVILRILTTILFSHVLFAGLAIALAALDFLFGVDVPGKRYGELWICILGIFAIWFLLAGIPSLPYSKDESAQYPKALKRFAQFILFPLLLLYVLILYAYLGKIILEWEWPNGWVSKLIFGFMTTGLVSLLLVHPIKDNEENHWIKKAAQWFYIITIPLLAMLFLALWQRISDYGVTVDRYLGIASAIWFSVVILYFLISRKKRIVFLSASLCAIALVVSFGPWGVFSISEQSQVKRLQEILVQHRVLVDGRAQSSHDSLPVNVTQQVNSILSYLYEFHGYDAIQPWFQGSLKRDSLGKGTSYQQPEKVAALLGVNFVRTQPTGDEGTVTFKSDRGTALELNGYNFLLRRQYLNLEKNHYEYTDVTYRINEDSNQMTVVLKYDPSRYDTVHINLKPFVDNLLAEYGRVPVDKIPPSKMVIVAEGDSTRMKFYIHSLSAQLHSKSTEINFVDFDLAYKRKE